MTLLNRRKPAGNSPELVVASSSQERSQRRKLKTLSKERERELSSLGCDSEDYSSGM
jgi:hypothetical protein